MESEFEGKGIGGGKGCVAGDETEGVWAVTGHSSLVGEAGMGRISGVEGGGGIGVSVSGVMEVG
jgi:hypothetical protein